MNKTILIWYLCIITLLTSCNNNNSVSKNTPSQGETEKNTNSLNENKAIKNGASLLQDGDLVMRSDNDFESLTLQNFSDSDRTYSHSGIAFKEEGTFVIYHSMTGSENPSGLCRKDPFDSFVSPARKTGFGIFRYQLSDKEKENFHTAMKSNVAAKIPFDLTFNLKTDDSLYCSEMIYKALKKATSNRVQLPNSTLTNFQPKIFGFKYKNVFLKKYDYISLDNLYLNPFCKEIIRVTYKQ